MPASHLSALLFELVDAALSKHKKLLKKQQKYEENFEELLERKFTKPDVEWKDAKYVRFVPFVIIPSVSSRSPTESGEALEFPQA